MSTRTSPCTPMVCGRHGTRETGRLDLRLEVRCNAIAAAILTPRAAVLGLTEVAIAAPRSESWTDSALETGARTFGVSVEAFLRRLLTLGRTTEKFYQQERQEMLRCLHRALARRKEGGGGGNWQLDEGPQPGQGLRPRGNQRAPAFADRHVHRGLLPRRKVQQLRRLGQEATLKADVQ